MEKRATSRKLSADTLWRTSWFVGQLLRPAMQRRNEHEIDANGGMPVMETAPPFEERAELYATALLGGRVAVSNTVDPNKLFDELHTAARKIAPFMSELAQCGPAEMAQEHVIDLDVLAVPDTLITEPSVPIGPSLNIGGDNYPIAC